MIGENDRGNGTQDTDGDGVIDSEDYAPRDPDVQRKEQVKGNELTETPTETPTETLNPSTGTVSRTNSEEEVFQTGRVTGSPDEINPGDTLQITGRVETEIPAARDNITYGVVGYADGTVLSVDYVGGSSGTVVSEATISNPPRGNILVWTFKAQTSESAARNGFQREANRDEYANGESAIILARFE